MSNLISASVQRRLVGSATRKSVLGYMADKAADDGSGIWTSKAISPAISNCRDAPCSWRSRELIRDGLVTETGQRDCKHGFTVEYSIVIEANG